MWWGVGIGGLIYIVLIVTLGVTTLRNGHGWLFFFGIFLPILWIIGAFMQAVRGRGAEAEPASDVKRVRRRSECNETA